MARAMMSKDEEILLDESDEKSTVDAQELKRQVEDFRRKMQQKEKFGDDFETDLQNLVTANDPQPVSSAKDSKTSSVGDKLVEKGLITRDQLEIAIKEQRQSPTKKDLGKILVELNFISDSVLSDFLEEASGVKSIDLTEIPLDPELIKKVPKNLASQYKIIPISMENDELTVATSDIYNVLAFDQIKRHFSRNVRVVPLYANDLQISEIIEQYFDYQMDMNEIIKEIESGNTAYTGQEEGYVNPTVRLVDSIILDAVKQGASDIHLEPEGEFIRLRYRLDGILRQVMSFHKQYWPAIVVRIKIMAGLNIAETRYPQDGRITYGIMGRKVDFRISTMPTIHGENIVARILDRNKSLVSITELGLTEENLKKLKRLLKRPEGVVIVTGPTGSGKTTTLYAILSHINSMDINIMTLEDPVEYQLPIIRQSHIREGAELTFEGGIRSLMRQDPDVIFVGEVRDHETAGMTVRAAMTGHQVFSTLHTNDAIGALPRLIDMDIKPQMLSGTIICVVAQRLARRLCIHCREEYVASSEECKMMGVNHEIAPKIYRHKGCSKCYNTGYKGRVPIFEILEIDREFDDLIAKNATRKEMFEYAKNHGHVTMADDAILKVIEGITDLQEIIDTIDMTERLKNVNLYV